MARLNIYLPPTLSLELEAWRGRMNFSEICAAALQAEVSARMTARNAVGLPSTVLHAPSVVEEQLMQRFGLRLTNVRALSVDSDGQYDDLARGAADFLDSAIYEGLQLGISGGTQMWSMVRHLRARNLCLSIGAIGFGHVDREVPHVHANVLATLLSLLYAPRSTVTLVGASDFALSWRPEGTAKRDVRRVIIGSCARFDAESAHARLLGDEITDFLVDENVIGEFLGVFLTADGRRIEPYLPTTTVSHIGSADLRDSARRSDTLVVLVAGGEAKLSTIRAVLDAELCNTMITDEKTARRLLLRRSGSGD
jgi:DNA-binding transcriptional regulator LsrR (DeoR family)